MTLLKDQLEFEEGRKLTTYVCSQNHKTIGIGHNLDAKPTYKGFKIPNRISDSFCDELFDDDVKEATAALTKVYPNVAKLTPARRDALINMTFQLGAGGVSKFKGMLRALDEKDWQLAHKEALDSTWAGQTPARAKRVASQILTGEYYDVKKDSI